MSRFVGRGFDTGVFPIALDTGLDTYLRQINQAPLLTAEEEASLARSIHRAAELADLFNQGQCSLQEKEEAELEARCARERMVSANLRLVVTIARKFGNRGMALNDLIEEGNLGLLRAVDGFDPDQGNRFSTYAAWWIKQSIKRSLINGVQPIHIPAYMMEMISRLREAKRRFIEDHGRMPTESELARSMQMPERKVAIIKQAVSGYTAPTQTVDAETGVSLPELLPCDKTPSPDESVLDEAQTELIEKILEKVDDREATILRLRYGLGGGEGLTFKEVGAKIGLTRERVRQIEIEALRKLSEIMVDDA